MREQGERQIGEKRESGGQGEREIGAKVGWRAPPLLVVEEEKVPIAVQVDLRNSTEYFLLGSENSRLIRAGNIEAFV